MVGSCKIAVGSGLASLLLAFWQQLEWFLRLTANLINRFLHICNTNITPHFWGVNLVVPS